MDTRSPGPLWDLWLPLVAALVACGMMVLAGVAGRSLAQRDELVLDGRLLRLAHNAERELRDGGPDAAAEVLESLLADAQPAVTALALVDAGGAEVAAAGSPPAASPIRQEPLFLGPQWGRRAHGGPPSLGQHGRGRLLLRMTLAPGSERPPLVARLILPATALAAFALLALAVLGGRLLVRQRLATERAGERRRLEGLGRAGAGLAHQLRTPLATIKGSCQLLNEERGDEHPSPRLAAALAAAARMERLLSRLLDYARPPQPEPTAVLLAALLAEVADNRAEIQADPAAVALADPEHLRQIVENLLDNALAAAPEGSPVTVSARPHKHEVVVVVADSGPGPGAEPEDLFEPYVTNRVDGTGLGLPIARTLAEANGGSLTLRPRPSGGCEAVLRLPAAPGAP